MTVYVHFRHQLREIKTIDYYQRKISEILVLTEWNENTSAQNHSAMLPPVKFALEQR